MGLVQVIESYGVKLRRGGKEMVGLCPFHDDHNPSLSVNPDKDICIVLGVRLAEIPRVL